MALIRRYKILCVTLVICVMQESNGQLNASEKICTINIRSDTNDGIMRITNTVEMNVTLTASICCKGYSFVNTPQCPRPCSTNCKSGYCPPDQTANCNCFVNYNVTAASQCLPDCTNCKHNEICTAPNNCTCNEQEYTQDPRNGLCVPTACWEQCRHGACDVEGRCHCKSTSTNATVACVNGKCDEQGMCNCLENYLEDDVLDGVCIPQSCRDNCINGSCNSLGECKCFNGLVSDGNYSCVAQMPSYVECQCAHGKCINGTCVCNAGYENSGDGQDPCIAICPSTDEDDEVHRQLCADQCTIRCESGTCTELGICNCMEGYEKDSLKQCVDITCPSVDDAMYCKNACEAQCGAGNCDGKGNCECKTGYRKSPDENYVCDPICAECASNEECSSRGKCTCEEGSLKISPGGNCVQKCKHQSCVNGDCDVEGKCVCGKGYELDANNLCVAVCLENCVFGYCGAPDKCVCQRGHVMDAAKKCVPHCQRGCQHGKCVARNRCRCDGGYYLTIAGDCQDNCHRDDSCMWKKVSKFVGLGSIFSFFVGVVVFLIFYRRNKSAVLPMTSGDVDTFPLADMTSGQSGKPEDRKPEETRKDAPTTELACLSYSCMEEEHVVERPDTNLGEVKGEDGVKIEVVKETMQTLSYSRLQEENVTDEKNVTEQGGEEKEVKEAKLVEIQEPELQGNDDADERDVAKQNGEEKEVKEAIIVEILEPKQQGIDYENDKVGD